MLLDDLTEHLGPLEEWPMYVLQHLFLDHPNPTRTYSLRKIMLFFYGNDVPLTMACTFYVACCGCTGGTARFVVGLVLRMELSTV